MDSSRDVPGRVRSRQTKSSEPTDRSKSPHQASPIDLELPHPKTLEEKTPEELHQLYLENHATLTRALSETPLPIFGLHGTGRANIESLQQVQSGTLFCLCPSNPLATEDDLLCLYDIVAHVFHYTKGEDGGILAFNFEAIESFSSELQAISETLSHPEIAGRGVFLFPGVNVKPMYSHAISKTESPLDPPSLAEAKEKRSALMAAANGPVEDETIRVVVKSGMTFPVQTVWEFTNPEWEAGFSGVVFRDKWQASPYRVSYSSELNVQAVATELINALSGRMRKS